MALQGIKRGRPRGYTDSLVERMKAVGVPESDTQMRNGKMDEHQYAVAIVGNENRKKENKISNS